jgi:predicted PurR-regulated permease PerM
MIAKLANTALWIALCLVTFWGDWSRVLLFGALFGIGVWVKADAIDSRVPPRTDAVITASIIGVLVILIFAVAFGASVVISKLRPRENQDKPNKRMQATGVPPVPDP